MKDAETVDHSWWGWFWTTIEHGAFVALIVALGVEFMALKLAEPHKKAVDDAKDLKIAELNTEAARLRKITSWREVDESQAKTIVDALAGKKSDGHFVLLNWQDPEQAQFFMSISGVCNKIGIICRVYPLKNPYPAAFPPVGTLSFAYDDADQTIIDAFKAAGLITGRVGTAVGDLLFPDGIRSGIVIGPKPSPLGSEAWRTNAPPR